jgi:dihydrodipicolinate synthase/N-acetylneuraminate lyase
MLDPFGTEEDAMNAAAGFRVLANVAMPLDIRAAAHEGAQYPVSRDSTACLLEYVIANGVDGVVIGDRVELGRMSYSERERYFTEAVEAAGGAISTYTLASASSTQGALRLVKVAGHAGATGVIASFPGVLPNKKNLAGYFRDIVEAAQAFDLEVFVAEEARGEALTSAVMEELGYRGVRGIVWSRYDMIELDSIRIHKPDHCLIFARNDYIGRELGNDVDGVISDLANIDPLGIGYFFRQLYVDKCLTKELQGIWSRYLPLLRLMRTDRIMVRACIEDALAQTFPEGFPAFFMPPRGKLDVDQENRLRVALEHMKPKDHRVPHR